MTSLAVENLAVRYGPVIAVAGVTFNVQAG